MEKQLKELALGKSLVENLKKLKKKNCFNYSKHDADEILKLLDDIPSTPVPPGDYKGSKTVSIPDNILASVLGKGFYEVTANLINPDGSQLTCVEATMTAK